VTGTSQALPPWSPLNDPQLYAHYQEKLKSGREPVRRKAQFLMELLSRYAWQEYPVKYGCWVLNETGLTGGTNLSGPWTKRAYTADYSWIQLLDPSTRRPLARHRIDTSFEGGMLVKAVPFSSQNTTSIWFAGDPRAYGVFAPVGDGHAGYFGTRPGASPFEVWQKGPQEFGQWAATIADTLDRRPGGGNADVLWLADHPQAPPNPKRFGAARG
jgi:hypothetical protein